MLRRSTAIVGKRVGKRVCRGGGVSVRCVVDRGGCGRFALAEEFDQRLSVLGEKLQSNPHRSELPVKIKMRNVRL